MPRRVNYTMKSISLLAGLYPGESCQIIGSGPSLAQLSPDDLVNGPIIAINHAIKTIEKMNLSNPVYSMQKDQRFTDCKAPVFAHIHESAKDNNFGDYVFDCEADFSIAWDIPSIVVCLHVAKMFGCEEVIYLCCDSFWGDLRSYDGEKTVLDYRQIHYEQHPALVREHAKNIGMQWRAL